jgi:predicted nucleotidyltransferase component of viral defense system
MIRKDIKNLQASIRQRLENQARKVGRPFNEVLHYYAMERFLYRLSKSKHADKFVLKGALLLVVWRASQTRPTRDIDFLGQLSNRLPTIASAVRDICQQEVEPDGLAFDPQSITTTRIAEDADYEGVRVKLHGRLGPARLFIQVDVGFGDVIVPAPILGEYPTLLDLPAPRLYTYTRETTIAEKFEAMTKLGTLNSRMKDFFDIWLLSRQFEFDGDTLSEAISKTFVHRGTQIQLHPEGWSARFIEDPRKIAQWRAFCRNTGLKQAPTDFGDVVHGVAGFLTPVAHALVEHRAFKDRWQPPGPWA